MHVLLHNWFQINSYLLPLGRVHAMDSQVVGKVYSLDTLKALPEVRLHSQRVLCCSKNRGEENVDRALTTTVASTK